MSKPVMDLHPGEIRAVGVLEMPAVVVCVDSDGPFGFDVRVVPVSYGVDNSVATDRDVIIAKHEVSDSRESIGMLAHAWLAEPVLPADVGSLRGEVTAAALQRIRDVELVALGAVDAASHDAARGNISYLDAAGDEDSYVRILHRAWRDNLELTAFVDQGGQLETVNARANAKAFVQFDYKFVETVIASNPSDGPPLPTSTQEFARALALAA